MLQAAKMTADKSALGQVWQLKAWHFSTILKSEVKNVLLI